MSTQNTQPVRAQQSATTSTLPLISQDDWNVLTLLRMTALKCRASAHSDLFEACALLTLEKPAAHQAFAEALARTLGQALGKQPIFFRPGVCELSFDEHWLAALLRTYRAGDNASFHFMLAARVDAPARRHLAFLVARLAAFSR